MEMQAQVQHQGQRGRAAAVRAGGRREGGRRVVSVQKEEVTPFLGEEEVQPARR